MAKRMGIVQELILFLKTNKAYWIAPVVIMLLLLIFVIAFAPTYAPWIYTIF